jgi:hypothetical protein
LELQREHIRRQQIQLNWPFTSMPEDRMVKKVYKWKPILRRPLGRPKNKCEDDTRNGIKN